MNTKEHIDSIGKRQEVQFPGSLRDYFATAAMQGLLASDATLRSTFDEISSSAYAQADSMLQEREKEQRETEDIKE